MSLYNLIAHFKDCIELPIKVDDVRRWIIDNGFQEEIIFNPTDSNPAILKGLTVQYITRDTVYGDPKRVTLITYPLKLNSCWERFVCCKEMIHILDSKESRTASSEEINDLTLSLTSPNENRTTSPALIADESAIISSLRVLAPISIIDAIRPE